MEQNGAFSTLLRTLGYDLYTIGARVFHSHDRGQVRGLGHMAIILTLGNVEYLVDVGFGLRPNCAAANIQWTSYRRPNKGIDS